MVIATKDSPFVHSYHWLFLESMNGEPVFGAASTGSHTANCGFQSTTDVSRQYLGLRVACLHPLGLREVPSKTSVVAAGREIHWWSLR